MKFVKIRDWYINIDNILKFYVCNGNNDEYSIYFEYVNKEVEKIVFCGYSTDTDDYVYDEEQRCEFYKAIENLKNAGIEIELTEI